MCRDSFNHLIIKKTKKNPSDLKYQQDKYKLQTGHRESYSRGMQLVTLTSKLVKYTNIVSTSVNSTLVIHLNYLLVQFKLTHDYE